MIVKDEASVIARCLASVRPFIDYWVIVDTGSTDDTPDVVREALRDIPGELHQRPWLDFARNRTEALDLARAHGDYTLIIDADDVLEPSPEFRLPFLTADSYAIEIWNKERHYWRPQLVSSSLPWRFEGVLHEFLSLGVDKSGNRLFAENRSQGRLSGVKIRMSEQGARRRLSAAERYKRDAALLEGALATETDPFLRARYKFYLGQSYLDSGEKEKALAVYQERAALGFWDQEVFISLYRSANLKAELGFDEEDVIASYLRAHAVRKDRAEALHGAARYCRIKQRYQQGFELAQQALQITPPDEGLFLEDWVYRYALLDEFAVNAYWIGRYGDCLAACERLLSEGKIPAEMRARLEQNAQHAREKLAFPGVDSKKDIADTVSVQSYRNLATPAGRRAYTELEINGEAFDRPPCPVRAKIFLCSTPRTGSYLLCRAMIHCGIGVPHEYFNGINAGIISSRYGLGTIDSRGLEVDGAARQAYIAALLERRTINGIFAAKIQRGQFRQYFNNSGGLALFRDAHFIYIYREDLLAQAISLHMSVLTGRWGIDNFVTTRPAANPKFFDNDQIAKYLEELTTQDKEWRSYFTSKGIKPLSLSYESMKGDLAGTLRRIVKAFSLQLESPNFHYVEAAPVEFRATGEPTKSEIKNHFKAAVRDKLSLGADAKANLAQPIHAAISLNDAFITLYNSAERLHEERQPFEDVIAAYDRASAAAPNRAEALHAASRLCRENKKFAEGYEYARRGLAIPPPGDGLRVEQWIYDYGLLDEFAVHAYWTGRYAECADACDRLLREGKLPADHRDRVLKNKASAIGKIREAAALQSAESSAFIRLLLAAREKEQLARPDDEVISAYAQASAAAPARAEALHGAARFCRNRGLHERGYQFAAQGLAMAYPKDAPGVEDWIYDYGLLDELAVNAYWTGRYKECVEACDRLLTGGKLPAEKRDRVLKNKQFAIDKLKDAAAPPVSDDRRERFETSRLQEPAASQPEAPRGGAQENLPSSGQPGGAQAPQPRVVDPHMSKRLHVLGVAHTIPNEDYLVCAFTAKVLLFPEVIQPLGWDVIEYSNEGSASKAREHVVILTKDRLHALSQRSSRNEPLDADVNNAALRSEFQRELLAKLRSRAKRGDIVCHVWGPNMEVYDLLRDCQHIELSVGYYASPGLPFRVYESSAWMHWHYGKAGQQDGSHYKWVIPSAFDADRWTFNDKPDDYALFLGRVASRKGINTLVEIARRMPELPIHVYGPGDLARWAKDAPPNLMFKGPIFGDERVEVVGRARCMLMPTNFIEPFGFSGIEAQMCGVPLIAASYGAFQETVVEGVTGYRCHTLADWVEAIRISRSLDRRQIATLARGKYSKEVVGKQYDWVFRQLSDLSGRGWYGDKSRKFAGTAAAPQETRPRKPRIWLYMPYFGPLPNYFQLYLDSLGKNADYLSVFLITDNDLSGYRVPDNLILIRQTLDALREKAARFVNGEFGMNVPADALLKQPYKLNDFRIIYLELFRDIGEQHGVSEDDFVGWGDCDLIYGRFADFLDMEEDYHVIGGFHGHLTAVRNIESFRKLFKAVEGLPALLLDEKSHIVDEIAFRKPLLDFLERNGYRMFYLNRYFCDIVPERFFGRFRQDHAQRTKNFFDAYHPDKEIDHVLYDRDGTLTVVYEDGDSRQSIYCHLQKRAMAMDFDRYENGYYIREDAFHLVSKADADADRSDVAKQHELLQ